MSEAASRRPNRGLRSPAAAPAAGAPSRRRRRVVAMAGAAACLCALLLVLSAAHVRPQSSGRNSAAVAVAGGKNAAGQPLLTPTRTTWEGHDLLYEAPQGARGLVLLLHKCGRSATDFWPRSTACPDCQGAARAGRRRSRPAGCCSRGSPAHQSCLSRCSPPQACPWAWPKPSRRCGGAMQWPP